MNVIELFLLLGIVAFLALWRWGGHLLVWLENVERALDGPEPEPDPVCTVEDEWFAECDPDARRHSEAECGCYTRERDLGSSAVIRERLDAEMRRRGHRGRR